MLFPFEAILGDETRSKVNVTSGAFPFGLEGLPNKTTVSPEDTDFTIAVPRAGKIGRSVVLSDEGFVEVIIVLLIKMVFSVLTVDC